MAGRKSEASKSMRSLKTGTTSLSASGARGGSDGSLYLGGNSLHRDRLDALIREGKVKIVQIGSAPVARTNPIPHLPGRTQTAWPSAPQNAWPSAQRKTKKDNKIGENTGISHWSSPLASVGGTSRGRIRTRTRDCIRNRVSARCSGPFFRARTLV